MLNILARKREEDAKKKKAIKESKKKSQLVTVSRACTERNLVDKKNEHDRLSAHYFNIRPGECLDHPEIERQRQELATYYNEKRRTLLTKLLEALNVGADIHFNEQKDILWKEYHEDFLPRLVDSMCHMILENARIVFSVKPNETNQHFSRIPGMVEGSLHEQISIKVSVYLEDSKKKVLEATEEQCALLTLKSMNIMANNVLDIEDYWREKTKRDVDSFHRLKMQEMSYKIDEERNELESHWSVNLASPRRSRKMEKEKLELEGSNKVSAEHDKYYLQAQRVKSSMCDSLENMVHDIRQEHYSALNVEELVDEATERFIERLDPDTTHKKETIPENESATHQSCYNNVAELRRMNLEANMFLQRMQSVAVNLQAEYDALSNSLDLDRLPSSSSDLSKYISDFDD